MRCLDSSDCTNWLAEFSVLETPYWQDTPFGVNYLQFSLTDPYEGSEVKKFLLWLDLRLPGLVQVTDWARFHDDLRDVGLRSLADEFPLEANKVSSTSRSGVLFESNEGVHLVDCCVEVVEQGMSAYLYLPGRVTLYLWEGELVDVWSRDARFFSELSLWLTNEGIRITGG
jgi:hypothetical protein